MSEGPYARLYMSLIDDPKFASIYDDDHHFAAWCRLLMIAEPAWPSSAHLPANVRKASVAALAAVELIDLLPGGRYRIHGLDAEREQRSAQASRASNARWNAPRNAASNAPSIPASNAQVPEPAMPNQVLVRERVQAEPTAREDADPADAYWSLTGRYPVGKSISWIDDMAGKYGQEATTRAMVKAHVEEPRNIGTLLGRTQNILAFEARALDRKEREDERERLREKRAQPKPLTGPDAEFRAMLEARYAELGKPRGAA